MTADGFNVRDVCREVVSTSVDVNYDAMAEEVLRRIPKSQYVTALAVALRPFLRQVVSEMRTPGPVAAPGPADSVVSWNVTSIREGWQKRLLEVYATAEGNKRLRDMTHDDLVYMAEELRRQAAQKHAKASGWQLLADSVEANGVERVGDLPAEILMQSLGAVA